MSEGVNRWFYLIDEISLMAITIGTIMAVYLMTWGDVAPELFNRGVFFLIIMYAGLGSWVMSGRAGFDILIRQPFQAILVALFIAVGVVATGLAQTAVVIASAPFLALVPDSVTPVYLAMAGISETYFLFGLYALLAGRLHWLIATPLVLAVTWFEHNYAYGLAPEALLAVVVSFLVQCLLFELSKRFTVPLGIHIVFNLLPLIMGAMTVAMVLVTVVVTML